MPPPAQPNIQAADEPTGTAWEEGADPSQRRLPAAAMLFEISTEVCNQVGGIYQVLRSKAPSLISKWQNRYCLIGPYDETRAAVEFDPKPATGKFESLVEQCAAAGLPVHHGHWLVPGRPRVLLLDHRLPISSLDHAKFLLWKQLGIDFPAGDQTVDLSVSFSQAALTLLRAASGLWPLESAGGQPRLIAHFHEWLGGLAIPAVRRERLPVATVFTTHATLLGRYIASNDERFYDNLSRIDHASEATRYNVRCQHGIERACAHGAHVFTTVSPITGEECAALLGRPVDLVLPNGLAMDHFDVGHEFQTMHAQCKERINRFTMGYFFPSYTFDLDRTIYMFTSGRFEPRNKGFDLCLESLARLNAQLKAFDLGVTVVFFLITRRPTRSLHPQALQSRGVLEELRDVCSHIVEEVGERMFPRAARGERVNLDELVDQYWALRYRRTQQALKVQGLPPVLTHVLDDELSDPVLCHIRQLGLLNRPEDPVKIVYHPDFVNPANPLWGIEYEQFVRGCHLGVFPSAYEPWGYTPLECVAMGVPSITSDLAGFGRYAVENYPMHDQWGLTVLKRRGRTYHDAAAELARWLLAFCRLERRGRIDLRNEVERHASEFDWGRLVRSYHQSHAMALERAAADAV